MSDRAIEDFLAQAKLDLEKRERKQEEVWSNRPAEDISSSRSYHERERSERREREQRSERERSERSDRDRRDRNNGRDNRERDRPRERERERDRDYDRRDRSPPRRGRSSPPPVRRKRGRDKDEILQSLENVIPINERKRRQNSLWDVKPPGYENVTVDMAKLSGLFPMTGVNPAKANNKQVPGGIGNGGSGSQIQGSGSQGIGGRSGPLALPPPSALLLADNSQNLKAEKSRLSKIVIISGFEAITSEPVEKITRLFINLFLSLANNGDIPKNTGDLVTDCFISKDIDDRNGNSESSGNEVIVVEFSSSPLATIAVAFNGIPLEEITENGEDSNNSKFYIRRPKDYIIPEEQEEKEDGEKTGNGSDKDGINKIVPDGPNKGLIANIPSFINDTQILELLRAFGEPKSFNLLTDIAGVSKGIAFFEYKDSRLLDLACQGLNNVALGDNLLIVKRACEGLNQSIGIPITNVDALIKLARDKHRKFPETKVMQLLNAVAPEEITNEEDCTEICDQVRSECSKFGQVVDVKVAKDLATSSNVMGGKIFVKFASPSVCKEAVAQLGGRKFSDRTIISAFYGEESFDLGIF